jgi:uncharacterized protein
MNTALKFIHRNMHEISVDGRRMLFHIPTSSLFEMDSLCSRILDEFKQRPDVPREQILRTLTGHYPVHEIDEAVNELRRLEIIADDVPAPDVSRTVFNEFPLTTIVLNVNTGCNLSCSYCYKEDVTTPAAGARMDPATAQQSIDMLLQESPAQDHYNIVFFGGEPLSNMPLIRQVVDYAEAVFQQHDKQVEFSLTTNATLLQDSVVDYLDQHHFGITVSMDGPPQYHDRNRITVGGKGTYAVVAAKARRLLERYKSRPVGARVTLTRGITDVTGIWDHLFNQLGFHEVGFAPVTSGEVTGYNLDTAELQQVFANMKALGRQYYTAALHHKNIGFANLHRLLTDISEGSRKALPCGAGAGMVAVDKDGGVNLCHRFAGSDVPLFGNVHRGLDHDALGQFLLQRMDRSGTECANCHIRNLCSGGCYHESYTRYGDLTRPVYHYCELLRDWIDFGLEIYLKIMARNPAFIENHITPRR